MSNYAEVTDESTRLRHGVNKAAAEMADALDSALARAEKAERAQERLVVALEMSDGDLVKARERAEKAEAAQDKAILERDRDVAQAESDRDEALVSPNGQLRDLEYECAKASKERDGWKARAEKAERERDAHKGDLDAEESGNAALRRDFGARPDETMCEFVARLKLDCDQAKARTRELEYMAERCQACIWEPVALRVHIGKEEWTLDELVDAFLSYRSRAEEAEKERDRLRKLFDDAGEGGYNVLALIDHYQDSALKTNNSRAEMAAHLRDCEAERDRLMAGACAICATCEGPLTCAKCVPVTEDRTPTLASRLEKLEARVVPVFCSMCGAAYAPGMPPACGHRSGDSADKFEVKP